MVRHSKSASTAPILTQKERAGKSNLGLGTASTRVSTASQLPFGYCNLTNMPTDGNAVATKSGHIYSKEAILGYLLDQKREIRERKETQDRETRDAEDRLIREGYREEEKVKEQFRQQQLTSSIKAAVHVDDEDGAYKCDAKRRRLIDDSTDEERVNALSKVSPWLPVFTPAAETALVKVNSKGREQDKMGVMETVVQREERPLSPFSKQHLRVKDLISLDLQRDPDTSSSSGTVRYQCNITRKPITSQRVIVLRPTSVVMLEEVARTLAYPELRCPITGKKFCRESDVLELKAAATGFSSSGNVESKQYRLNMN